MYKAMELKITKAYDFICYGKGKEITIKGCLRHCPKLEEANNDNTITYFYTNK